MTTNHVTVAEELEAQLYESKAPLPTDLEGFKAEYDKLTTQEAEIKARKEEIKTLVGLMADAKGVKMFTVNGVNAFGFTETTQTSVDRKKLQTEFPEVAAAVITTTTASRFFSKK